MIKVLIADDHHVVREGLRRVLEAAPDIQVVKEVGRGDQVADGVRESSPDVVLLDISMPGPDFLEVIRASTASRPGTRVLVLSAHPEEEFAIRAIRGGAAGYISKGHSPRELVEAVRRISAGGRFISPALAEQLAIGLAEEASQPVHQRLSNREFEVLRLIAAGRSLKEVAATLNINPKTVSSFRTRLLAKLELKTNADLVRYALEHKLIE